MAKNQSGAPVKKAMTTAPTKKAVAPKPVQNRMQKTDSALWSDAGRESKQAMWTRAISSASSNMAKDKGVDSNKVKSAERMLANKADSLERSSKANMDALKKRPSAMAKRPTAMPTTTTKKKK